MTVGKEFESLTHGILWDAAHDLRIPARAYDKVTPSELIDEVAPQRDTWRSAVAPELYSWQRDQAALDDIWASARARFERHPYSGPDSSLLDAIIGLFSSSAERKARTERMVRRDPEYRQAVQNEQETREVLGNALRERCVLPALRTALNARIAPSDPEGTLLVETDTSGLYQLVPVGFELQSIGRRRLEHLLRSSTSASIGIAGPRGSGKTTLLSWICDRPYGRTKELRLVIPAPAKYEARDYLLFLLITICRATLDRFGVPHAERNRQGDEQRFPLGPYVRRTCLIAGGAVAGVVAFAVSLVWNFQEHLIARPVLQNALSLYTLLFSILLGVTIMVQGCLEPLRDLVYLRRPHVLGLFNRAVVAFSSIRLLTAAGVIYFIIAPTYTDLPPFRIVLNAAATIGAAILLYVLGRRSKMDGWDPRGLDPFLVRRLYGSDGTENPLVLHARQTLIRASYQHARAENRSDRIGVSASVGITVSSDITSGSSETLSTVPWTRPEIVAEIRRVLREIATRYGSVTIGIDELDKIESADQATQFIDDIKGIFGVPKCHFLVSVSEDALAQFERRGMPFRSSFDSAFDDIVALRYFSFEESQRLVRSRLFGTPLKYIALCHALSGGLPRDLIRCLRHMYELTLPIELNTAASSIVAEELSRKSELMAASLHNSTLYPWVEMFAVWTDRAGLDVAHPDRLLDVTAELSKMCNSAIESAAALSDTDWRAITTCKEMAAYTYYCTTIVQICNCGFDTEDRSSNAMTDLLCGMALARQAFAAHTSLSWSRIDAVRAQAGWPILASPHWR